MEIAKGGRPVKVLNETEITKLEALACCLTKSQAAEYFGMTAKHCAPLKKDSQRFLPLIGEVAQRR